MLPPRLTSRQYSQLSGSSSFAMSRSKIGLNTPGAAGRRCTWVIASAYAMYASWKR